MVTQTETTEKDAGENPAATQDMTPDELNGLIWGLVIVMVPVLLLGSYIADHLF